MSIVYESPSVDSVNPAIILSVPETVQRLPIIGAEIIDAHTTTLCVILKISPPMSSSDVVARSVTLAETALDPRPVTDCHKSVII